MSLSNLQMKLFTGGNYQVIGEKLRLALNVATV